MKCECQGQSEEVLSGIVMPLLLILQKSVFQVGIAAGEWQLIERQQFSYRRRHFQRHPADLIAHCRRLCAAPNGRRTYRDGRMLTQP